MPSLTLMAVVCDRPDASVTERAGTVDRTQVVIMVPNIRCDERFTWPLKKHLQGKHDRIHKVNVESAGKIRSPGKTGELLFDIGTIAKVTFTIDSSKSTLVDPAVTHLQTF